jgi:predicted RNA methylase
MPPPPSLMNYYSNVTPDLLARVAAGAGRVLEVGCGNGNLGRAYLALNPHL